MTLYALLVQGCKRNRRPILQVQDSFSKHAIEKKVVKTAMAVIPIVIRPVMVDATNLVIVLVHLEMPIAVVVAIALATLLATRTAAQIVTRIAVYVLMVVVAKEEVVAVVVVPQEATRVVCRGVANCLLRIRWKRLQRMEVVAVPVALQMRI